MLPALRALGVAGGLLAVCGTASAQQYERVLGAPNRAERAFDVEEYGNGGSVTAGVLEDPAGGFSAVHVVRYDPFGIPIWEFAYDRPGRDVAYSVDIAPNGDIVVAGWSTSAAGGVQTLVMRLSPTGAPIWANVYTGTSGLFPLHTEEHGPQVVVGRDGAISVITNFQGLAAAFQVSPAGALVWSNLYFDPTSDGDERDTQFAFTDIKEDDDNSLVISGTVRVRDATGALPFPMVQDPMLVRLSPGGLPVASSHYNLSGGFDDDVAEVGEGLDLNLERAEIVVAGENIAPAGGLPVPRQMILRTASSFLPLSAGAFSGPAPALAETGSAAVRFNADFSQFAVAGRDGFPGGPATLTAFRPDATPLRRYHSFDIAEFDSVAGSRASCGYFAAGRTNAIEPAGDIFYAKTNDALMTGCNQRVPPQFAGLEPREIDLPMQPIEQPERIPLQFEVFDPQNPEREICFNAFCGPCPADWDMNGVVDIFDILAFLGDWNAMVPAADYDMNGSIDIFDILAFLADWNAGCV